MPSVSPSQQRLFGMVLAAKRGEMKNAPAKIKKVAGGISESSAEDFAKTKFKKKSRQNVSRSLMTGKSGY